jgi:hypothetical protein
VILFLAAGLRLCYFGVEEYRKDEAQLTWLDLDMTHGKSFPLLGIPASIGLPNSPMTIYMLLPPFLISDNPLMAIAYIALLNVIGVGLLWLIAYRYVGRGVAFVAGLAYAVNPWAVIYSRKIWAQDYHTPIILLAIFLGLYGFIEKKRWAQILCLPVLLIGLQIHFAAWSLVPVYLVLLWYGRKNTTWRTLALSGVLGVLVMFPYAIGIAQTLGQFSAIPPARWNAQRILDPAQQIADLTTGLDLVGTFAHDQAADFLRQVSQPIPLWSVAGIFALIGVVVVIGGKRPRYLKVTLLLWAFITVITTTIGAILGQFGSFWIQSFTHYYIPTIPIICVFMGIGVMAVVTWRPQNKSIMIAIGGLAAVLFASQSLAIIGMLSYVDTHMTTSGLGFGMPVHYLLNVGDVLRPYQDIIVVNGDNRDLPSMGIPIWKSLLHDGERCIRNVGLDDSITVFPNKPFAVVFGQTQSRTNLAPLKAIYQVTNPIMVPVMRDAEPFQVYPLQSLQWSGAALKDLSPTHFVNGMTLTGYHVAENQLILRWVLPAANGIAYKTLIAYDSADGKVLNQHEEPFWPSYNWCADDTVVNWIAIAPPNGTTQLMVSLKASVNGHPSVATKTGKTTVTIPFDVSSNHS